MAAVTPPYALGRHTIITVAPMTKATTGTFATADGAYPYPLQGRVSSHGLGTTLETSNHSPMHSFAKNPVPMEIGSSFSVSEDGFASADVDSATPGPTKGNVLKTCAKKSFYAKVQVSLVDEAGAELDRILILGLWTQVPSYTAEKGTVAWTGTLETVALFDATTGAPILNPYFGTGTAPF